MFACNAFGSQRMSCISESHSTFWYWDYARRGGVSKMQLSVFDLPLWDWEMRFVAGHHLPGVWLSDTPWHLQMIDSSVGRSSAQEWQGSGVRGRGHREQGHILAPEKTNSDTFLELRIFLKQERGYIFLHFFSSFSFSFQRFWSCLWEKVLLRYQYIMKKLFSLFSICCVFFSFLKNA